MAVSSWLAAALLLCAPSGTHAHFGSRGGGGGGHGGGGSRASGGHGNGGARGASRSNSGGRATIMLSGRSSYWALPVPRIVAGPVYRSSALIVIPASAAVVSSYPPPADNLEENTEQPVAANLAFDVGWLNAGPALGVHTYLEGYRAGVALGYTGIFRTDSLAGSDEQIHLVSAHLTYALLTSEHGRLRAELGLHIAGAPDVTFVAPGVGVSGVVELVGGFGLEARCYANVWPYTQFDTHAGFVWADRNFAVLWGGRAIYLDDNGVLGAANAGATSDFFFGPYVGFALAN
jgi:hypothetical protein